MVFFYITFIQVRSCQCQNGYCPSPEVPFSQIPRGKSGCRGDNFECNRLHFWNVANACTPPCKPYRQRLPNASVRLRVPLHSVYIFPRGSHHVVSFQLHTCWTRLPRHAVIPLFTNHKVKAHGVTGNERKIHVICYITVLSIHQRLKKL